MATKFPSSRILVVLSMCYRIPKTKSRCLWVHSSPSHFSIPKRSCSSTNADPSKYSVIVVGGGHAGTEACHAAARMGARTLLVTHKIESIGEMSCNPSFGGIGKGHLLREIDALDGVCTRICDISGLQYRVLNRRKGPAVWGLRAQMDRNLYRKNMQKEITNTPNLSIVSGSVEDLIINTRTDDTVECSGVILADGRKYESRCVILTTGTFLRANINIGLEARPAGRMGDEPSIGLANTLKELNFKIDRLRTGTPPRLEMSTINFENLGYVEGDDPSIPFSFLNERVWIEPKDQLRCYKTLTNKNVEEICRRSLKFNRHVREEVRGPRYCPSIESKSLRYTDVDHLVWLEPEGFDSSVIYPGGISCTMPAEMQEEMIHAIPGLENAKILRYGYGVEYEFIDPIELTPALETKKINGLFFAGQINGTTGYEEAAAQGILAGINSAAKVQGKEEFLISRSEGYIGVLVDDLTSMGADEPYRMFTSRSEFRLHLRPDNADLRLTQRGYKVGCVSEARYKHFCRTQEDFLNGMDILSSIEKTTNKWREALNLSPCRRNRVQSADQLFSAGLTITIDMLEQVFPEDFKDISKNPHVRLKLISEGIYCRQLEENLKRMEDMKIEESFRIPSQINYNEIGLRFEEVEKLSLIRPHSIAAASRIPGVTPAGILRLMYYIRNNYNHDTPTAKKVSM